MSHSGARGAYGARDELDMVSYLLGQLERDRCGAEPLDCWDKRQIEEVLIRYRLLLAEDVNHLVTKLLWNRGYSEKGEQGVQ